MDTDQARRGAVLTVAAGVQESCFLSTAAPLPEPRAGVQQSGAPLKGGAPTSAATPANIVALPPAGKEEISPDPCGPQSGPGCLHTGGPARRALQRGTAPRPSSVLETARRHCRRLYFGDEETRKIECFPAPPRNIADRISVSYSVFDEEALIKSLFRSAFNV